MHGDPKRLDVQSGRLKPWRTAAEIIDWSLPCPSIFGRKKPLCENTMRRIARGLKKFVIDNPEPFIVQVNHSGDCFRGQGLDAPLSTVTAKHGYGLVTPYIAQIGQSGFAGDKRQYEVTEPLTTIVTKAEHLLVTPYLIQYHGEQSAKEVRGQSVNRPLMVVDASPRYAIVTAFISKYFSGGYTVPGPGASIDDPLPTVTAIGSSMDEPLHTITASGQHIGEVRAFLLKYYGQGEGQSLIEPLHTVTSKDRFGLVIIHGDLYQIIDIGMRMLSPRELFDAQGFPRDYIIARDYAGKIYTKTAQVARCGNAVPPQFADALVRANLPEMCVANKTKVG